MIFLAQLIFQPSRFNYSLSPNGLIQIPELEAQRVVIFNPLGQSIAEYELPGRSLDISTLPRGVYHLLFFVVESQYSARVVKTN